MPNRLLSAIGLKMIPLSSAATRFPVAIDDRDKAVCQYLREKRLSTPTDERPFAPVMACH
jgi:hypothetical protein